MASLRRRATGLLRGRAAGVDLAGAAALALGLAVAAAIQGPDNPARRAVAVVAAAGFLVLTVRRSHPAIALAGTLATVIGNELLAPKTGAQIPSFLAILLATYSFSLRAERRTLAIGLMLASGAVAVGHSLGAGTAAQHSEAGAIAFFIAFLVVGPSVVGGIVRAHSLLIERLATATRRLRSIQSERVALALAGERTRIGSEVEAVVLRGLEAMGEHRDARTLGAVNALESIARQTLADMRRLLAGLRDESDERTPTPALSDLRAHVAATLAAEPPGSARSGAPSLARERWVLVSGTTITTALTVMASVLTIALVATTLADSTLHAPRAVDALLAAGLVAPVAFLWRLPLPATAVIAASAIALAAIGQPLDPMSGLPPISLLVIAPLTVAVRCTLPRALGAAAMCAAASMLAFPVDPGSRFGITDALTAFAVLIGSWVAGRALGARARLLRALARTGAELQRATDARERDALAAERGRVAGELHDAVAHAMTVIVLQAGAAGRVWTSHAQRAREHAGALRRVVAEVVGELRPLVLSLRVAGPEVAPGLDSLDALTDRARMSGLDVALLIEGQPARLAPDVERAAYRIVQEGLTNAARHAPGAQAVVRVTMSPAPSPSRWTTTGRPVPSGVNTAEVTVCVA